MSSERTITVIYCGFCGMHCTVYHCGGRPVFCPHCGLSTEDAAGVSSMRAREEHSKAEAVSGGVLSPGSELSDYIEDLKKTITGLREMNESLLDMIATLDVDKQWLQEENWELQNQIERGRQL
jgi:hypothetical protein